MHIKHISPREGEKFEYEYKTKGDLARINNHELGV